MAVLNPEWTGGRVHICPHVHIRPHVSTLRQSRVNHAVAESNHARPAGNVKPQARQSRVHSRRPANHATITQSRRKLKPQVRQSRDQSRESRINATHARRPLRAGRSVLFDQPQPAIAWQALPSWVAGTGARGLVCGPLPWANQDRRIRLAPMRKEHRR